jgi:hypothetical protein
MTRHNPGAGPGAGHEGPERAHDEAGICAPSPYQLGLTINPDLSWEDIGIAQPAPFDLFGGNDPDLSWEDFEAEP